MLVPNQYITVNWHPRNKAHLESKGYIYTHTGLPVQVKVEDMMVGSKCRVKVQCDYCGKIYTKIYKDYFAQRQNGKDCCAKCASKKRGETNQELYGGNAPACSPKVVEKMQKSCLDKYGVKVPSKSSKVKAKMREVNMERYGFPVPCQNPSVRAKLIKTNQKRHGGNGSQCNPEVRKKTMQSFIKHGTICSSEPEREMVKKLQALYGSKNCFPQYLLDKIVFDCLVIVNGVKIDVEFDGKYWHKDKHKDIRRDYYSFSQGYKVLRFSGDNDAPTEEQIKQGIDFLVTTTHRHLIIDV